MSILDVAGELEPRQGRVVTQTITRPYTTIIATVTLGGDGYAATSTSEPASGGIPTESTTSTSTLPVTPTSSSSLTPDQLGAILGSIFGTLFVVVFFWYYCVVVRRRRRSYGAGDSESSFDEQDERARIERWYRYRAMFGPEMVARPGPALVPPPPRIPPSRPMPGYRQTSYPQFRGTHRYP